MGGIRGVITGALALAALEAIVSSDRGTSGIASLAKVPGQWAQTFLSPAKPLLPNFVNAPCAEQGDLSLFSALSASYQAPIDGGAVPAQPVTSIPPPSTLPPVVQPISNAPTTPPSTGGGRYIPV